MTPRARQRHRGLCPVGDAVALVACHPDHAGPELVGKGQIKARESGTSLQAFGQLPGQFGLACLRQTPT